MEIMRSALVPEADRAAAGPDAVRTPLMSARLAFREALLGIGLPEILGAGD